MSITVDYVQAKDLITEAIKAKLVPMLAGSPAVGKSSIVHKIAEEYGLKVIDVRLAQCDPTDLLGFPHIDRERNKAMYVPMSTFPVEGDNVPDGYNGWLLFLDEFNSADRGVQKAAYKLVLDRMIGEFQLHDQVAIVCAGNLETDNAIVEEMSTALQSRLIHLELHVDHEQWIDWATENGVDHRITSFVKYKPGLLYNFDANHTDKTYASPRTWTFASKLLHQMGIEHKQLLPILAGTISEGVAREFIAFTRIYTQLPSIDEIIAKASSIPVPAEPSILYALTGTISHNITEKNVTDLMVFINRLPVEFQVVCLREIVRRKKELLKHSALVDWIRINSQELF